MWDPPADTLATLVMPATVTGTALGLPVAPSPRVPHLLTPHAMTLPVLSSAALSWPPAVIDDTPDRPLTATAVS